MAALETNKSRPPILCLGCPRTGTASLGEALRILGSNRIHHGIRMSNAAPEWDILDRASDATFPLLPTYTNKPFTRQEWDEWCEDWDVVTDIAALFAVSLVPAYPDAKVILVERDFEPWFKSWTSVHSPWASTKSLRMITSIEKRCGVKGGIVSAKFCTGWAGVTEMEGLLDKEAVRKAHQRHYAFIRENVPRDQLLDFKLSQGWEPLCAFLGKDIPDQPFPHINDSMEYSKYRKAKRNENLKMWAKTFVPGGRKRVHADNQRQTEEIVEKLKKQSNGVVVEQT